MMSRPYPEAVALLAIASVLSCTSPQTAATPERTSVEASLAGVTSAAAIERVKAAFVAEGMAIAEASSAGTVVSVPYNPRPDKLISTPMTFRATVLGGDAGSRVIFTASYRDNKPITSRDGRFLGEEGWQRLERMAAAVQRSP